MRLCETINLFCLTMKKDMCMYKLQTCSFPCVSPNHLRCANNPLVCIAVISLDRPDMFSRYVPVPMDMCTVKLCCESRAAEVRGTSSRLACPRPSYGLVVGLLLHAHPSGVVLGRRLLAATSAQHVKGRKSGSGQVENAG